MRHISFVSVVCSLTVLAALAACGSRPPPAQNPQRSEPASAPAPRSEPGAVAQPRPPAEACTREGETCKAAGSVCCPGLICTGSASGICISRR